jgi:hypothetical protein
MTKNGWVYSKASVLAFQREQVSFAALSAQQS